LNIRKRAAKAVAEFLEFFRPADFIALCVISIFATVDNFVGRDHFVDAVSTTVIPDFFETSMENVVLFFCHGRLPCLQRVSV